MIPSAASSRFKPTDHVIEIAAPVGRLGPARRQEIRLAASPRSRSRRRKHDLAVERIKAAGLADRIAVELEDYRDHQGSYAGSASPSSMTEALGHKYLPAFCASIGRLLKPDGIAAFQYITCPDSRYAQFRDGVDFIQKHIFPGSLAALIDRVGELMTQ
jgi:cyclopropane-fatty-acyl-phospholipid synthase